MIKKLFCVILLFFACAAVNVVGQETVRVNIGDNSVRESDLSSGHALWEGRLPRVAVKTNLLYDLTTTINLGVEFATGRRTTIDLSGNYNGWTFSENRKIKHYMIQPEFRYWLCERFNGSFFGIHLLGGEANVGGIKLPFGILPNLATHRYEGWFVGGGISYGYQWILSPRWNLEATVGAGIIFVDYKRFECQVCGRENGNGKKLLFAPTKVGLSLMYFFNHKR